MHCSRLQKVVRSSQILLLAVPFVMGDGVKFQCSSGFDHLLSPVSQSGCASF